MVHNLHNLYANISIEILKEKSINKYSVNFRLLEITSMLLNVASANLFSV